MEAKAQKWWPRGEKPLIPVSFLFELEGGEFLSAENVPPPPLLNIFVQGLLA